MGWPNEYLVYIIYVFVLCCAVCLVSCWVWLLLIVEQCQREAKVHVYGRPARIPSGPSRWVFGVGVHATSACGVEILKQEQNWLGFQFHTQKCLCSKLVNFESNVKHSVKVIFGMKSTEEISSLCFMNGTCFALNSCYLVWQLMTLVAVIYIVSQISSLILIRGTLNS